MAKKQIKFAFFVIFLIIFKLINNYLLFKIIVTGPEFS